MTEDEFRDEVVTHARDNDGHYITWNTDGDTWTAVCSVGDWALEQPAP